MKLVYIASLSHSGSTVLNLSLGNHPRLIGLGEAFWVTRFSRERLEEELVMPCTCGQPVRQCPYWSKVFEAMLNNLAASSADRYRILLDLFYDQFGEDAIPVDASKFLPSLRDIRKNPDLDIQIVHLIKDVRPFTISQRDIIAKEIKYEVIRRFTSSESFDTFLHLNTTRSAIYLFYKWYLRNQYIQRELIRENLKYMQLGYEDFALYPQQTLAHISQFLGIEMVDDMLTPDGAGSHIVFGNQMLGNKKKKASIIYDNRWFYRNDYQFSSLISPHIMRYNARTVYNLRKK